MHLLSNLLSRFYFVFIVLLSRFYLFSVFVILSTKTTPENSTPEILVLIAYICEQQWLR